MRVVSWVLLLAGLAVAQQTLEQLFDPYDRTHGLRMYERGAFSRLPKAGHLRARGVDPRLWKDPPKVDNQIPQAHSIRGALRRGFYYAERLRAKQRAFDRLARRMPLPKTLQVIGKLQEVDPAKFAESN